MTERMTRRQLLQRGLLIAGGAVLYAACAPSEEREPDPTAVAERVKKLRSEAILNTPETGVYNKKNLLRWQEIEPQPKIDERIGIAILPSKYVRGEGSIAWHTQVAAKLGFQRVAVPISPNEFADHTGIELSQKPTLDALVKYSEFDALFNHPGITAIHITCDVGGTNTVSGWQFPNEGAFTPERLQATYEEYRRTSEYLLQRYGHLGKEITISGPNEMELLAKGGWNSTTEDEDISETAFKNMVSYYDKIHRAVRDANAAHEGKTPLLTGAEVLQIRTEIGENDPLTGLDVIEALSVLPDVVTLSAWQFSGKGEGGYWLEKAMEEVQQSTSASRVAITEYGVADSDREDLTREQIANYYVKDIQGAFSGGVEYVVVWGLTGFNSKNGKINPNNNELRGLGLIRPDGSVRKEVYEVLKKYPAET
ncbi:MAG: hypothetical protein ACC618_00665 [Patescibacteria group bacterium]